jgi:hypothetical protein
MFASTEPFPVPATRRRNARPALFNGYWFDASGRRLGRATRTDLATAYRLWAVHADVRAGRAA